RARSPGAKVTRRALVAERSVFGGVPLRSLAAARALRTRPAAHLAGSCLTCQWICGEAPRQERDQLSGAGAPQGDGLPQILDTEVVLPQIPENQHPLGWLGRRLLDSEQPFLNEQVWLVHSQGSAHWRRPGEAWIDLEDHRPSVMHSHLSVEWARRAK